MNALAIAQERYDFMSDDAPEDPAVTAVNELLRSHPDFQLTARNIEDGLREPKQDDLDEFYSDLQTFMVYEERGLTEMARAKALEIVRAWASQVRTQWHADAGQMHKDSTEGYA